MSKRYQVNEVFYSVQGEGVRAGTANCFVRLSGCNLQCNGQQDGEAFAPVCDTEFVSGVRMALPELLTRIVATGPVRWVILTGGEPGLQVDAELIAALHDANIMVAIETNGTQELPGDIDWITVSPKTAEHTLKITQCNEVKYVRHQGQGIPKTTVKAEHYIISPAFEASGFLDPATLQWCIKLVKENPKWRLSVQQHKTWKVR